MADPESVKQRVESRVLQLGPIGIGWFRRAPYCRKALSDTAVTRSPRYPSSTTSGRGTE
jgi:hypothetical protein